MKQNFLGSSKKFLLKNTLKVDLHYLFNVFIPLNIVFNLKLKTKNRPKECIFLKTWKKFGKPEKILKIRVALCYI